MFKLFKRSPQSGIRVRRKPSIFSKIVGMVYPGTVFTAYEEAVDMRRDLWVKITTEVNGIEVDLGWVRAKHLARSKNLVQVYHKDI